MIVVTGGAGMIGSNIIKALNNRGYHDVLVVDNLKNGKKVFNLSDLRISDYIAKDNFRSLIKADSSFSVSAIFHMGADSSTTEWNGAHLMDNNYEYSKDILKWAVYRKIPFIYASSASVYGLGLSGFSEDRSNEMPINAYAYSKMQFDEYMRAFTRKSYSQVVGLRYFNVYGPREGHKGHMASTAYHFYKQALEKKIIRLFEGDDGIGDGEQRRDFVYVEDCALVNLWFLDHPDTSGIFNVGTGTATTFNAMANHIISHVPEAEIEYIPFPDHLRGSYQNFTQAELCRLREVGCDINFRDIQAGIRDYVNWAQTSHLFR